MAVDTQSLIQQLQSIDKTSLSGADARVELLKAAHALSQRLEPPYEWATRTTWAEVCTLTVLQIFKEAILAASAPFDSHLVVFGPFGLQKAQL